MISNVRIAWTDAPETAEACRVKILFVCGPWGSGTSVVTHILLRLGSLGLVPYYRSNDPKTENTYESILFREILLYLADEHNFSKTKENDVAIQEFIKLKSGLLQYISANKMIVGEAPVVLKHGLSCLFLNELDTIFDARFIFVRRDIDEIEFGRIRRGWPPFHGAEGAMKAYSCMDNFLNSKRKIYTIRYRHLLENPINEVQRLAKFCNLRDDKDSVKNAIAPLKRHYNYLAVNRNKT